MLRPRAGRASRSRPTAIWRNPSWRTSSELVSAVVGGYLKGLRRCGLAAGRPPLGRPTEAGAEQRDDLAALGEALQVSLAEDRLAVDVDLEAALVTGAQVYAGQH